jgi:Bacterial Ig domain/Putative Ig domain
MKSGDTMDAAAAAAQGGERATEAAAQRLPVGLARFPYEARLEQGDPRGPFVVTDGALPPGLTLDTLTGAITGRPAYAGRYQFTVRSTDRQGRPWQQTLAITVDETTGSYDDAPKSFVPSDERRRALSVGTSTTGELGSLATIVAGMAEGEWRKVNLNSYSSVWTPVDLRVLYLGGALPPDRIIMAWSGFGWDSSRGLLFLYGGGHANYRGNDTYIWRASTQRWERASLPSEMVVQPLGPVNAIDGAANAPASAHTYDTTTYLPLLDRMVVFGGAADSNGGHFLTQDSPTSTTVRSTGPYFFDTSRAHPDKVGGTTGSHVKRVAPYPEIVGGNMWSNRESWLNASATSIPPYESMVNSCTGYAQEGGRDVVYLRTGYNIYRYQAGDLDNPASDRWSRAGRYWYGGSGDTGTCGYDPVRKLLVSNYESFTQPFIFWNMATQGPMNLDTLVTPADPNGEFMPLVASRAIDLRYCGMEYDPPRGKFKIWCGDGRVWTLTPPNTPSATGWSIARERTPVDPVPSESVGTGILGKWKYIPNFDVFMGLADPVQGNIWIYKPVGWVNPFIGANLPPSVSLTAPTSGTSVPDGASIGITATASDGDGSIARVEFFADSTKIGESLLAPYGMLWSGMTSGTYALTARATDDGGAVTTSVAVTVTVQPPPPPNVPPTVSWVAPANGSVIGVGTSVTLDATAADSDGGVTKVEFFAGGSKLGEATTSPYRYVWANPPLGDHMLTAMATDDDGATTLTAARTLTVSASPPVATTVNLQRGLTPGNVGDTYLSRYHRTLAFGGATLLPDERNNYSTLVRFAVFQSEGGPVPNGARITSAVLSVYKQSAYNVSYGAHRMLVDWSESTATWNQPRSGASWASAGANGAGTDFANSADATASVGWDPGWLNFDVTAALQAMSLAPMPANYGWRLRATTGLTHALKYFYASEYGGATTLRPKLVITYE